MTRRGGKDVRTSVGLTKQAVEALEYLGELLDLSNTDVINQSILINYELMKIQASGKVLQVSNPETNYSTELHILRH